MNNISRIRPMHLLAGGALMLFASLSHAQYMWLDEKGMKQFSDRPPPNSVPKKNILKSPASPVVTSTPIESASGEPAAPAVPAAGGPPTLADREVDYRKRSKEKAEADQKQRDETLKKAEKQANCEAARQYKAQLDTGERVGVMRNGERSIMGDDERAQQQSVASKLIEGCK